MKGLCVGNGFAGRRHVAALQELGHEVKCYDRDVTRTDFKTLLGALRLFNPDIVVFADTPKSRISYLECYQKMLVNKIIVVEKPPCRPCDLDRYKKLGKRLKLYPVHNYLFMPISVQDEGKPWDIVIERTEPHKGWYCDEEESGGGILLDHGYHYLYVLLHNGVDIRPKFMEVDRVPDMNCLLGNDEYAIRLSWTCDARRTEVNGSVFEPRSDWMEKSIKQFLHAVISGSITTYNDSVKIMEVIRDVYENCKGG